MTKIWNGHQWWRNNGESGGENIGVMKYSVAKYSNDNENDSALSIMRKSMKM